MEQEVPLYQMQPQTRFSNRAPDYARFRPSYPASAIAWILAGLKTPTELIAADIGAGTGISSRLLAERGLQVWAIEPNLAMQGVAQFHPRVTFQTATAEQTDLPPASVDLVTCFQAFHWCDPHPALREFCRILRPSGRLALVWNERDRQDPFTAAYSQVIRQASGNHPAENRLQATNPLELLQNSPLFHQVRQRTFVYRQELNLSGLIGRATSTSYLPREGPGFEQLVTCLTELHQTWKDDQEKVCLSYHTNIFLAEANSI